MTTTKTAQPRDPVELACLRLFQQGRATYSDGRDHIRMAAGIIGTVVIVVTLALGGAAFWLTLLVAFGSIAATSSWIVVAGQRAGQQRAAEIEARYAREG